MVGGPDIRSFSTLLHAVDVEGSQRFVYSYVREDGADGVRGFLEELKAKRKGRLTPYLVSFRMVGMRGMAPWEKWHMLDADDPPRGIAKVAGVPLSLKGMGVFKNIPDKSRIYHCVEPGGLFVLLTVFEGKNESDLTADAVNPALWAREEYFRRKTVLIAKSQGRTS